MTYNVATDFAVLCPNCHRIIHRMPDPSDLAALRGLVLSPRLHERVTFDKASPASEHRRACTWHARHTAFKPRAPRRPHAPAPAPRPPARCALCPRRRYTRAERWSDGRPRQFRRGARSPPFQNDFRTAPRTGSPLPRQAPDASNRLRPAVPTCYDRRRHLGGSPCPA